MVERGSERSCKGGGDEVQAFDVAASEGSDDRVMVAVRSRERLMNFESYRACSILQDPVAAHGEQAIEFVMFSIYQG